MCFFELRVVDKKRNILTWIVETVFNTTKRGRHPLGGSVSPPTAATPPSLKRARHDSESNSPLVTGDQDMEAPLAVQLSQSMDSVNTATGEEEVSFVYSRKTIEFIPYLSFRYGKETLRLGKIFFCFPDDFSATICMPQG